MRCIEHPRPLCVLVGILFCLLTIVQTTRPILAAAMSTTHAAPVHRQLTRNCVEEVGTDLPDVLPDPLTLSTFEKGDSELPRISEPEQPALPAWSPQPIHRKLLPPSPEDG
jgi:hypothetical protein